MYRYELDKYCARHNLEAVEQYETHGDERGPHVRAIVRNQETGEKYYLYYDTSRRRRSLARQKRDVEIYHAGGIPESPPSRGWRNTTLENRRRKNKNK